MSTNVSIVTDTAKDVTARTVVDYGAGVFSHINGDYAQHSQVRIHATPYADSTGDVISVNSLRLLLTDSSAGNVDVAVVLPITSSGTTSAFGSPPIIITQPANTEAVIFGTAQFTVGAISDTPITYQWRKFGRESETFENINGAFAASLVLSNIHNQDYGLYNVICSNINGSVTSNNARLSLTTASVAAKKKKDKGSSFNPFFDPLPQIFGFF